MTFLHHIISSILGQVRASNTTKLTSTHGEKGHIWVGVVYLFITYYYIAAFHG